MHCVESVWPPRLHSNRAPAAFNSIPQEERSPVDDSHRTSALVDRAPSDLSDGRDTIILRDEKDSFFGRARIYNELRLNDENQPGYSRKGTKGRASVHKIENETRSDRHRRDGIQPAQPDGLLDKIRREFRYFYVG